MLQIYIIWEVMLEDIAAPPREWPSIPPDSCQILAICTSLMLGPTCWRWAVYASAIVRLWNWGGGPYMWVVLGHTCSLGCAHQCLAWKEVYGSVPWALFLFSLPMWGMWGRASRKGIVGWRMGQVGESSMVGVVKKRVVMWHHIHHPPNWAVRAPQPQPLPGHVTWLNTCKKWSHVQQQFTFILHRVHHIPSDDESSPSEKQCSQSKCKTILPPRSTFKTCDKCHNSKLRKRGRGNERRKGRGVYIGRSTFRQHLKMVGQETEMWNGCTHSDDQRLCWWTRVSNFIPGSPLFENSSKRRGGVLPACRNLSQLWTSIQFKPGSVTDNVGELNGKRNVLSSVHKVIRCNQTKLQFLLPQHSDHVNTILRREASLKCLSSVNWSWIKTLICHVTCPGRGWGWGAGCKQMNTSATH